jgi:uncharacterized membrane protein YphA (DoxX/SURF4 family)
MTTALWTTQISLGAAFTLAGIFKAFGYERAKTTMPWVGTVPEGLVRFIGVSELLGGLGLILPLATGVAPFITPLAAIGLAITMVLAAAFHARRGELYAIPVNVVLFAMAVFVSYGGSSLG